MQSKQINNQSIERNYKLLTCMINWNKGDFLYKLERIDLSKV